MAKERYPIRIDDDTRFMSASAWSLPVLTILGFYNRSFNET